MLGRRCSLCNGKLNSKNIKYVLVDNQNLGAKQYNRVKKTFVLCMAYGGLLVLAACLLMFPFGRQLLGLYITDSPDAIEFGLLRMRYMRVDSLQSGYIPESRYSEL